MKKTTRLSEQKLKEELNQDARMERVFATVKTYFIITVITTLLVFVLSLLGHGKL